jgi:DNA-binding NarL/FixJ family response regulator
MRVLMVDDHVMFLQGLKNLLGVIAPTANIDTADSLSFALQLLRSATYDLVLLDWHLADGTGDKSIQRLRDSGCMGRIVILSGETSVCLIRGSIEQGAAGFIPKKYSSEQMVAALDHVLAGKIFLPPECLTQSGETTPGSKGTDDPRFRELTARQVDAYRAAARGLSNKLIAEELGVAESTVKSHLSAVYAVLGVRNRTEAAYQASRDGTRIA